MAADFSHKKNDHTALIIARKILEAFPPEKWSWDFSGNLCAFLLKYAGLAYIDSMTILNSIAFNGTAFDCLRLAYALIHYKKEAAFTLIQRKAYTAHGKIMEVSADRVDGANPKVCVKLLLTSSSLAGRLVEYSMPVRDAVKLQRQIYSGRSKALSGRSLLEFVGCVCTARLFGLSVQYITADKQEKEMNKQLCAERTKADHDCQKAHSCVQCKERRAQCKLAVRH